MKKLVLLLLTVSALYSCNTASPEKTFGIAALNCNLIYGFAGRMMEQQLANPSVKLVDEKTNATASMTRKEVIDQKIQAIEDNYNKVKDLSVNDENKAMIEASKALYSFVLPVYKNEYQELAKLYDDKAPSEQIDAMQKNIAEKYGAQFAQLYQAVLTTGKAYAEKNGIEVREVNPVPSN